MNATITSKKFESRELNDGELDDVSGGFFFGVLVGIAIGAGTTMIVTDVLAPKGTLKGLNVKSPPKKN